MPPKLHLPSTHLLYLAIIREADFFLDINMTHRLIILIGKLIILADLGLGTSNLDKEKRKDIPIQNEQEE